MRKIPYILAIMAMASCGGPNSQFQQDPALYGSMQYRFVQTSGDTTSIHPGDVIFLNMDYTTESGQLIYSSMDVDPNYRMYAPASDAIGTIEQALSLMHPGDSAIFKLPAGPFFANTRKVQLPKGISPDDLLTFHIRINRVVDGAEYQRQIDEYNARMEAQEKLILHDYIRNEYGTKITPTESGLYKTTTQQGKGKPAEPDSKVTIHFAGSLIDGTEFDNSYKRQEPFTFQLGTGKSIKGFEEGIAGMRKGEKATLIMPSTLGYGSRGVQGRIPAFATLIFQVEILDIE